MLRSRTVPLAPAFAYKPLHDTGNQSLYNNLTISTASTTAFQVQNASGTAALSVDTTQNQVALRNLNDGSVASGTELVYKLRKSAERWKLVWIGYGL